MDDDRYRRDHSDDDTDAEGRPAEQYRDAAVIGSIHTGGPPAGLAVAAAGFGKAGAAIACGSVAASITYAVIADRYRDSADDAEQAQPAYTAASAAPSDVAGSSMVDGNRQVLEALDEFGVLEDELSDDQQERYHETIQEIRED